MESRFDSDYYREFMVETEHGCETRLPQAVMDYFEYSERIIHEKDVSKKLEYCHKQLKLLPWYVWKELNSPYFKFLPPLIACRDCAPKLYMRMGKWEEAKDFILACIDANAYYPDRGEKELEYLEKYKETALAALAYIEAYPGTLQKDLYDTLEQNGVDRDILKQFVRWTSLVRKVPHGKTNMLYAEHRKEVSSHWIGS